MENFEKMLKNTGEVGYVEQVFHSIIYVSGLPSAKPREVVIFESGGMGEIFALGTKYVEVLMLSNEQIPIGSKVARTGKRFQIAINQKLLGRSIDPVEVVRINDSETDEVDVLQSPLGMNYRSNIVDQLHTGLRLVDTVLPLGKGQRELVIGPRKSGKTEFVLHTALSAVSSGLIVIYAAIGKRRDDILKIESFVDKNKIRDKVVVVRTGSSDPAGRVFLTPYTAMTIAENLRSEGKDTLVIMDDLTAHASYYREVSLLARRFPGRNSYPGDIFYVHAQLMERAGNFTLAGGKTASITCLPIAELPAGELAGYIQTNLMAMTDGHLFFNADIYNEGRRPAIDIFLSVTRVGRQTQTQLLKDANTQLTKLLVEVDGLKQFMQFGSEMTEDTKKTLKQGELVTDFFNQTIGKITPIAINLFILAAVLADFWTDVKPELAADEIDQIESLYESEGKYKERVDALLADHNSFTALIETFKSQGDQILGLDRKSSIIHNEPNGKLQ